MARCSSAWPRLNNTSSNAPSAHWQGGGARCGHDHQHVDVEHPLADALPGIPHRVVATDGQRSGEQRHGDDVGVVPQTRHSTNQPSCKQQRACDSAHDQFAVLNVPRCFVMRFEHTVAQR